MENTINQTQEKKKPTEMYFENEQIRDEIIKEKEKFEKLLYKLELLDFCHYNRWKYIWQFMKTYLALSLISVLVIIIVWIFNLIFWLTKSDDWVLILMIIIMVIFWIIAWSDWKQNRNEVMSRNRWYESEWYKLRAEWKTTMTKKQYKEYRKKVDWY